MALFELTVYLGTTLGGSLVTMEWHIFRLQMEKASKYGG
jgi:hypothetical protein